MIKVTKIRNTCSACPAQWEGETEDGLAVYVRFRWGFLGIGTGKTLDDAIEGKGNAFEYDYGDFMDGYMTYAELKEVTAGQIEWPETDVAT